MNWNEVIGSSALVPLLPSSGVALDVPTATAAVGECFSERAGNLNLGVEGMMLSGAFSGFIGTYYTHSVAVGVLCGIGAGVLLGILMGGLSVWLKTEPVINGIALVLFAPGTHRIRVWEVVQHQQHSDDLDPGQPAHSGAGRHPGDRPGAVQAELALLYRGRGDARP